MMQLTFLKLRNIAEEGYLEPPKGESSKNWRKIKRLIFKSTYLVMIQIEPYKKMMALGHILLMMLHITWIK